MNPDVERRLESCTRLPTLPGVAIRILGLFQEKEVDFSRLTAVLSQDPALCAKVLRLVNSAHYGMSRRIAELDHAVALLGVDVVRTAALSFSLVGGLCGGHLDGHLSRCWRRSLISAVAARRLGAWCRMPNLDVLFLAGLLQDIGVLALAAAFPESYRTLLVAAGGDHGRLTDSERVELGEDHATAGSWLVSRWHLPPIYELALAGSHELGQVHPDPSVERIISITCLAGRLADIWAGSDAAGATACAARDLELGLGLGESDVRTLISEIQGNLPEISQLFEIDLGDPAILEEIAERARETLVDLSLENARRSQVMYLRTVNLEREVLDLREKSHRDPLTGLYNRTHLDQVLSFEFEQARGSGQPLSVALCDIDRFKHCNDTYGHLAGDRVLRAVARLLQRQIRKSDLLFRYGGEEFILVMPETGSRLAAALCESMCRLVGMHDQGLEPQGPVHVTISLGIATLSEKSSFESVTQMLQAADDALYAAKRSGRNQARAHAVEIL